MDSQIISVGDNYVLYNFWYAILQMVDFGLFLPEVVQFGFSS